MNGRIAAPLRPSTPWRRAGRHAAALLLLLAPATARAQAEASGGAARGDDRTARAMAADPGVRKAQAHLSQLEREAGKTWLAYVPTVAMQAGTFGSDSRIFTGQNDFGEARRLDAPISYRSSSVVQSISASVMLIDGGARRAARNALHASTLAATADLGTARQDVVVRLREGVRREREAQARIQLERELLAAADTFLQVVVRRHELAAVRGSDLRAAQLHVLRQQAAVADAILAERHASLNLAALFPDCPDDSAAHWADTDPSLPIATAAEMSERATRSALSVRRAEAVAALADARADAVASRWKPNVSARVGFTRSEALGSYDAMREWNPQDRSLSFGLSASLPLLDPSRLNGTVAEPQVDAHLAHLDVASARLAAVRTLQHALLDVDQAKARLELARATADVARAESADALAAYGHGLSTYDALLRAEEADATARRDVLQAADAVVDAIAAVRVAIGEVP